jgi:hypothetical protein
VMRKCVGSVEVDAEAVSDAEAKSVDDEACEDAEGGAEFRSRAWSALKYRAQGVRVQRAEVVRMACRTGCRERDSDISMCLMYWFHGRWREGLFN